MKIRGLDHFVLTVASIEDTCDFYCRVLGMERVEFGQGRQALAFGAQKINLHEKGAEFLPNAKNPAPGSADFCLIISTPLEDCMAHLKALDIAIEEGPVARTGAMGAIRSVYIRDPDGNLVELAEYRQD